VRRPIGIQKLHDRNEFTQPITKKNKNNTHFIGFLENNIAFNWIISSYLTKNSIKSDTFFPETLYITKSIFAGVKFQNTKNDLIHHSQIFSYSTSFWCLHLKDINTYISASHGNEAEYGENKFENRLFCSNRNMLTLFRLHNSRKT